MVSSEIQYTIGMRFYTGRNLAEGTMYPLTVACLLHLPRKKGVFLYVWVWVNRDQDKSDSSSAPGSERTNFRPKRPEQVGIRREERAFGPENRRF